jgi:Ni/Co efflux regulator RcnB
MRTLTIVAMVLSLGGMSAAADAQRIEGNTATTTIRTGPTISSVSGGSWEQTRTGNWNGPRPGQRGPVYQQHQVHQQRWGGDVNGHWYAGMHAPGGWNAYRHPARGWTLPRYWIAPSFYIGDFNSYGLSTPPYGYSWSRYYDDAVLVDQRGRVWDSVGGIDWNGNDDGYYADSGYANGSYPGDANYRDGYATWQSDYYSGGQYSDDRPYYRERRNDGVGGAVVGAVVGGVAGSLIAGHGNRVAGTLIGGGVGAVAGYAIDRSQDRRRHGAPPPPPPGYYDQQQPGVSYAPPREVVQSGGYSTSTSYSSDYQQVGQQGGYASGGYWYPPTTRTVVTIGSAPVTTTTTTTEYVETNYVAAHKVWRKKHVAWRPRARLRACTCACACR